MISQREATQMFGEEAVGEYHSAMQKSGEMVSLPFMVLNLGYDKATFTKKALVVVHPGHTQHSDYAGELYDENKDEYGDYHVEYLPSLMERLSEAKDSGETVLLYAMTEYFEETLDLVGGTDGLIVVPTYSNGGIDLKTLGVSAPEFLDYLKDRGIEKAEVIGEWNGACLDHVERILSRYGFDTEVGVKFPLNEKYKNKVLFEMTKEEDRKHNAFLKASDKWEMKTYSDYLSLLCVKEGSCEAKTLKYTIKFSQDPYIHPGRFYDECSPYDSAKIDKALEFLKDNGVVKMAKAREMLSDEIIREIDIDFGTPYKRFQIINKISAKQGHPEVDFVVVPLIECELLQ